jgi:hypothetical protein
MSVTRSVVYGVVGPCKTESSQKPVPVHPTISEALAKWREGSRFTKCDDWVFASRRHRGRKPIWGQAILRKYIRPVALRLGIEKRFGRHTFQHTYSTLLRSVGTEFKVMQELCGILPYDPHWMSTHRRSRRQNMRLKQRSLPWSSLPRRIHRTRVNSQVVKAEHVKTALITKKGCKTGAKMHPFAPPLP